MDFYVGEICLLFYNFVLLNWYDCDGSLLFIFEYDMFFNLIGIIYGGDGQNMFVLLDLCGCLFIYQGIGFGLSIYIMGQFVGMEIVMFIFGQMLVYMYMVVEISGVVIIGILGGNVELGVISGDFMYISDILGFILFVVVNIMIGFVGGNQLYDNIMLILIVWFCILLYGIYLSQVQYVGLCCELLRIKD